MSETESVTDDPTDWLTRNADHISKDSAQEGESWDRAKKGAPEANIVDEGRSLGRAAVALPDGEGIHETLLVQAPNGDMAGACDCDGWQYNDSACAHLCTLIILDGLDMRGIPTSGEYVSELMANNSESVSEKREGDESQDLEPHPSDEGPATAPAQRRDDAFASPMPDVDEKYVMELNDEQYIRKAGYARLLNSQGWRVANTEVLGAHETDWTRAKYRATIMDEDGNNLATAVGTAGPPDKEKLANADMHLDELAETRAWTRAAAIATGEGQTALAEVHPDKEDMA